MKVIKPYYEIQPQANTYEEKCKLIEKAGRICYKSEYKIDGTLEGAENFIRARIKQGHEGILEHAQLILEVPSIVAGQLSASPHITITDRERPKRCLVSGNVRSFRDVIRSGVVAITLMDFLSSKYPSFFKDVNSIESEHIPYYNENDFQLLSYDDLKTPLEKFQHGAITVFFVMDRGISHQIVRHRNSINQESTRYCNYSKGKFDGQCQFIQPPWIGEDFSQYVDIKLVGDYVDTSKIRHRVAFVSTDNFPMKSIDVSEKDYPWLLGCKNSEQDYLNLLNSGRKAEEARSMLNHSIKTELYYTARVKDWNWILKERTHKAAHPQFRELVIPLAEELQSRYDKVFDYYKEDLRNKLPDKIQEEFSKGN